MELQIRKQRNKSKYCSLDNLFGDGGGGGGAGAGAAQSFNQKAIDELKRQFNITQGNIQPFLDAGTNALPLVQQGTTAQGLDQRLAEIFNTDTFRNLLDERTRSTENYLGSAGLSRSGVGVEEIANLPASLGLQIEALLTGRATNLAGSGQNAAVGLGQIGQSNASSIASLYNNSGAAANQGIQTDAASGAQGSQNLLNTAVGLGSIFFSDPILKENVEEIGKIGDLNLYQWDWIPETKNTLVEKCGTIGFMADEVKEKYSQYVSDLCGLMVIDYPSLLDHLETNHA